MKTINWTKISPKFASDEEAVWKEILRMKDPVRLRYQVIEELFCQKKKEDAPEQNKQKKKQSTQIDLLDMKRSMNINIFLKQFKATNEAIIDMIRKGDESQFGSERLKGLIKNFPLKDEVETLKAFEGDRSKLGNAEKFLELLIAQPSYTIRIEGMLLKAEFQANYDSLRPDIDAVITATNAVLDSKSLNAFLRFTLQTGNFINAGGYAGNALGFKLSSLSKLYEIRANTARMTLLHFLVQEAEKENKEILTFVDDLLPPLKLASRVVIDSIKSDVRQLETSINTLTRQLENADDELKQQFLDFVNKAKADIQQLHNGLKHVADLSKKVAMHFCEDVKTSRLEDCVAVMLSFCEKVASCQKDNEQRKLQEERAAKRRAEQERIQKNKIPEKVVTIEEDDNCIIDRLLNGIKRGTSLRKQRRRRLTSSQVPARESVC